MTERKQKIKESFDKLVKQNGNALKRLAESDKIETNTERLESIKAKLSNFATSVWDISEDDYMWLYEQAERAQKLEKVYNVTNESWKEMLSEGIRLTEALEFYANPHNYSYDIDECENPYPYNCRILNDGGQKAEEVLGEETKSTNPISNPSNTSNDQNR